MKRYREFDLDHARPAGCARLQGEDGIFTAQAPAIRGGVAWGKTLIEPDRNAVDAIESCLESRRKGSALKLRKPRDAGLNVYRRPVHV